MWLASCYLFTFTEMPHRHLKFKMFKIKISFPHHIIHLSDFHRWWIKPSSNQFLKPEKWDTSERRNLYLLYSLCNHFYCTSRIILCLLLSICTSPVETHNFHPDYSSNFLTYLPISFMTSAIHSYIVAIKTYFQNLKCIKSLSFLKFSKIWRLCLEVGQILSIAGWNKHLRKLLLYSSLHSSENSYCILVGYYRLHILCHLTYSIIQWDKAFLIHLQHQCLYISHILSRLIQLCRITHLLSKYPSRNYYVGNI